MTDAITSFNPFWIREGMKTLRNRLSNVQDLIQDITKISSWTAQKDTTTDTTSDRQVNSNVPYRWSPANLTFNKYFYQFLYLYKTRITINNNTSHLKSPKNQKKKSPPLWTASKEITGGLELVCGRSTLALGSSLVHQKNNYEQQKQNE